MNRRNQRRLVAVAIAALLMIVAAAPSGAAGSEDELVAFERQAGTAGAADIYLVRPDGSGLRRLTSDSRSSDPAWSPGRRRIAFVSGRTGAFWAPELYVMDADGRNVRRLTRSPRTRGLFYAASEPAWTPDGKRIVFVRTAVRRGTSQSDLWSIGADGRGLRRLTATAGHEGSPSLSPFGMLAFTRQGEIRSKLLNEPSSGRIARGENPAWSPNGGLIVFSRDDGVYTIRADGTELRRVTTGVASSWSSDGTRVVVATPSGLVSVLANGTDARAVTRQPGTTSDLDASWSTPRTKAPRGLATLERRDAAFVDGDGSQAVAAPAARELVFVRGEGKARELYAIREDGTGLRRLTSNRAGEAAPVWSPDGKRVLFTSNRDGDDEVFVMNADDRNVRQLTRNRRLDLTPQWSPDGKLIAFASDRARRREPEIWVMRADGTGARRLVRTVNHATWQDEQYSPTFSPDGKRLIFTMAVAMDNPELHVIGIDGNGLKRLTRTRGSSGVFGDDTMPHWSRDGRTVVFVSNREQKSSDVWIMKANGTRQRPVVRLPGTDDWIPRLSADGRTIVFTRYPLADGAPTIWLMSTNGTGARRLTTGAEADWRP